jgi:hypothetical protein
VDQGFWIKLDPKLPQLENVNQVEQGVLYDPDINPELPPLFSGRLFKFGYETIDIQGRYFGPG